MQKECTVPSEFHMLLKNHGLLSATSSILGLGIKDKKKNWVLRIIKRKAKQLFLDLSLPNNTLKDWKIIYN